MMKIFVFLGAPGAGKGTVASRIAEQGDALAVQPSGQKLPWALGSVQIAGQKAYTVNIEGVTHLALSRPLPRHAYSAWVLAPLDGLQEHTAVMLG